jgi:carbonic anhydrase/acetyltransferase-like protein (isoleucine patch superfamily)
MTEASPSLTSAILTGPETKVAALITWSYGDPMAIYEIDGMAPRIDPSAYVHPDSVVIGNVTIGAESTIWPGAVLRGDYGVITIGARTSIQDGSVIHATAEHATTVGDGCVIGHLAHLEGCVLEDDSLVGSGSVVLHRAVIGYGATVGANAVVTNDMTVPAEALAVGVPAVIKEGRSSLVFNQGAAALYVANGKRYKTTLVRLDT